jgi:hypothetical protein
MLFGTWSVVVVRVVFLLFGTWDVILFRDSFVQEWWLNYCYSLGNWSGVLWQTNGSDEGKG